MICNTLNTITFKTLLILFYGQLSKSVFLRRRKYQEQNYIRLIYYVHN